MSAVRSLLLVIAFAVSSIAHGATVIVGPGGSPTMIRGLLFNDAYWNVQFRVGHYEQLVPGYVPTDVGGPDNALRLLDAMSDALAGVEVADQSYYLLPILFEPSAFPSPAEIGVVHGVILMYSSEFGWLGGDGGFFSWGFPDVPESWLLVQRVPEPPTSLLFLLSAGLLAFRFKRPP